MLRFLGKTTTSMARIGGSSPTEGCGTVGEGLSTWELVNASQSDDEELYSYDSDDVISEGDGAIGDELGPTPVQEEDGDYEDSREPRDFLAPGDVISIQALSVSPPMTFPVEMTRNYVHHDYAEGYDDDDVHDVDDDDDDDDDDVDDELVPWKLKDRFGKQRIRKMGKRGGPKINKSKRLPYHYNRPGCLYGKHGFGVQHSFI